MPNMTPDTATTNISYHGHRVHETLSAYPDVVRAVQAFCFGMLDAYIKIHVTPRRVDSEPLEWSLGIATPGGRKTYVVLQKNPAGKIFIKAS